MFESVAGSYPLYFQSNIAKLNGSMSKSMLKVIADRTSAEPQTLTNIRLPIGSLLALESLALNFKITTSGTHGVFPTRYSSSFIKRMSITMNNTTVSVINDYDLIYNLYADHTNKATTKGIAGEMLDNSVQWTTATGAGTGDGAISGVSALMNTTSNAGVYNMTVNNFIGLFGSASTGVISTSKIGEIVISIEWNSSASVLGGTGETTSVASGAYSDSKYAVSDINMTVESLSFSDNSFYDAIEASDDVKIAFDDYVVNKYATVTKNTGINITSYISAGSLEHCVGTTLVASAPTQQMVAWGSGGTGATEADVGNSYKYLADPIAYTGDTGAGNNGDAFFSTRALQRQGQHLESSQFSINNKQLNFGSLDRYEVFQNNLQCLGYLNTDASANGFNDKILSLEHYYKYYYGCFQSLSLLDRDTYYLSGLSSAGSSCAVNWVAKFSGNSTQAVTPVLIFKVNKVLHIGKGRSIFIET